MVGKIIFFFYLSFFKAIALLPFSLLYAVSDFMYYIIYDVIKYRRRIVRNNLNKSFPEKNHKEILEIEKLFYHHFCDLIIETIKLLHIKNKEINNRIFVDNADFVERIAANNKPIILFLGHYCNWEWVTAVSKHYKWPELTYQIYKPLRNNAFNSLMLKIRSRFDSISISQKMALKTILNTHQNEKSFIVGCIADGRPNRRTIKEPEIFFLNQKTSFMSGAELIGNKIGAVFLYLDIIKQERGKYRFVFKELKPSGNDKELPYTKAYYRMLEQTIKREPSYWLWTHRRWLYN